MGHYQDSASSLLQAPLHARLRHLAPHSYPKAEAGGTDSGQGKNCFTIQAFKQNNKGYNFLDYLKKAKIFANNPDYKRFEDVEPEVKEAEESKTRTDRVEQSRA